MGALQCLGNPENCQDYGSTTQAHITEVEDYPAISSASFICKRRSQSAYVAT